MAERKSPHGGDRSQREQHGKHEQRGDRQLDERKDKSNRSTGDDHAQTGASRTDTQRVETKKGPNSL